MKPTFSENLKSHPGAPYAALFTFVGVIAGSMSGIIVDALIGGALMSVFWIPVLISCYEPDDD